MKTSKSIFILLVALIGFSNVFAQDTNEAKLLDATALKMFENFNNKDYDALLDMTHPKLFEIVPKEAMGDLMVSMLEGNEEMAINIPNEIPEYKISSIFNDKENNINYAYLSYDMKMNMTYKNEAFDAETQATMSKMMQTQGMEIEFVSNNSMDLTIKNSITIFLKDTAKNTDWHMLNYDPNSPLLSQLLSTEIIEKTKEYKQNLMLESKKEN